MRVETRRGCPRSVCDDRPRTLATALYVGTDDLLKESPHRVPWRPERGISFSGGRLCRLIFWDNGGRDYLPLTCLMSPASALSCRTVALAILPTDADLMLGKIAPTARASP